MKIENSGDLDAAIDALERRKVLQEGMLADSFHATVDHFRPVNLIKSAFQSATHNTDVKSSVLKAVSGIGAGLLAKKLLIGKSSSLLGKLASTVIKVGAGNTVMHNSDKITAWGTAIYHNLFRKNHHDEES